MARQIAGPLPEADLEGLSGRYPLEYVGRQIEIFGLADPGPTVYDLTDDNDGEPEDDGLDDLLGVSDDGELSDFDPTQHTVEEIREHLAAASESEAQRVLAVESSRGDREPRAGVLKLLQ